MWSRAVSLFACPLCRGDLQLALEVGHDVPLEHSALREAESAGVRLRATELWVETGLLLCEPCRLRFPIVHGLPVMLPYTTQLHQDFDASEAGWLIRYSGYRSPSQNPVPGEQFVMRSFSKEWLEYDYDGVIWDLSYEDHQRRLMAELGVQNLAQGSLFLEIGSGLGLSTFFAQRALRGDAVGLDLSLAALTATRHFSDNPFLHFVQASVFWPPLRRHVADVVYSHGVLHHTYSTRDAFLRMATCCRLGGTLYLWVYGRDSTKGSAARRIAWQLERLLRPSIARRIDSLPARAALHLMAAPYMLGNAWHRARNSSVQRYTYQHALHAARDRFTPLFAHRHDYDEVASWFREAGFERIEQVDWRTMPSSNQDNYRRNVGVRGGALKAADKVDFGPSFHPEAAESLTV